MSLSSEKQEFDYAAYLSLFDIKDGDIVDVASDLFSIWDYCKQKNLMFNANHFIDAMIDSFGPNTTIMIRTFNWDFCHGVPFDIRRSPSRVGLLGDIALRRRDFRRTRHPLYSWMVIGPRQEEICNLNDPKAFGKGSMFDYLYQNSGKTIDVGNTSNDGMTQTHHCEVVGGVPYRWLKPFSGKYIHMDGSETIETYYMQVRPLNIDVQLRDLLIPEIEVIILNKSLEKRELYNDYLNVRTYYIQPFQDFMTDYFRNSDGSWLITSNGKPGFRDNGIDWNKAEYY